MGCLVEGLKQQICIEVLKAQVDSFEESTRVALSIDSAIWRVGKGSSFVWKGDSSESTPMELGSVEVREPSASKELKTCRMRRALHATRKGIGPGSMCNGRTMLKQTHMSKTMSYLTPRHKTSRSSARRPDSCSGSIRIRSTV